MKSYFALMGICILFWLPFNANAQSEPLKVITYNIWNGFDWGKDLQRQKDMVNWLKEQDADVVALQELNDFTPEKLKNLAREWGHSHTLLLKEEGYPVGISSKTPLELKTKMIGGMWHGMLHAKTRGVDFLVVHLSPQDWKFRGREAKMVRDYLQRAVIETGQEKYMVLGDFNAHSPFDAAFDANNPQARKIAIEADSIRRAENGEKAFINLRNNRIDYAAMSTFLSIPLIDVVQMQVAETNRKSFPTPLATKDLAPEKAAVYQQRLDYILVSTYFEGKCSYAEIINYGEPDELSDHYPVVAIFEDL